jgi:hypothetical protein
MVPKRPSAQHRAVLGDVVSGRAAFQRGLRDEAAYVRCQSHGVRR